ncbi:hypothetical protein TheveDRAFT_0261 [Thermanaerovibrio velox DSM 12556]|uniref:Uncharacterized protein n=1 Tax=Thermanaerovibrio velox DSM 12556 TaxID=926567 RepID=H0UNV1_9BACT|nr:hypothetical protein TheveDRAFT_0261 [Thermanaerovibrio velox DSM 12556]
MKPGNLSPLGGVVPTPAAFCRMIREAQRLF